MTHGAKFTEIDWIKMQGHVVSSSSTSELISKADNNKNLLKPRNFVTYLVVVEL